MSKRTTTSWYIGAWIVAVVCAIVAGLAGRSISGASALVTMLVWTIILCAIVMFVTWIGALVNLAHQRSWGWFGFLLVFHVLSVGVLGIIPMIAYAMAGPPDGGTPIVIRPSTT